MERVGDGVLAYSSASTRRATRPNGRARSSSAASLDPSTFKFLLGTREQLAPVWRAYGIAPVNATHEEAIAAAEATDAFLAAVDNKPPRRKYVAARARRAGGRRGLLSRSRRPRYRGRSRHDQGLDFEHSAYVMLIDKHGRQRVGIPFEQIDVAGLAADMSALLNEP